MTLEDTFTATITHERWRRFRGPKRFDEVHTITHVMYRLYRAVDLIHYQNNQYKMH